MTDKEVLALTPEFPDNFSEILQDLFIWDEYMFTWKNEINKKMGYCTHCKQEMCLELGRQYTTEDIEQYQRKHNQKGLCPNCKTPVIWKNRNRGRKKLFEENYLFYFQSLSNGGIILRSLFCRKSFQTNIKSKVEWDEQYRIFFFDGHIYKFRRRPSAPYFYYTIDDWYNQNDSDFCWDRIKKLSTPTPFGSKMFGAFYGCIKYAIDDSIFKKGQYKYSCLREWLNYRMNNFSGFNYAVEYLSLFTKNPSLTEKLMKQKLEAIIWQKFSIDTRGIINWNKATVSEALKLNKSDVKSLKAKSITEIFTLQCKQVYGITENNQKKLSEMCRNIYEKDSFKKIFKVQEIKSNKVITYLSKNKVNCQEYTDYLNQLNELNIKKTDTALYPKNFNEAHNHLSAELTRIAQEKERALALEQQQKFKAKYKKLLKELYFENEQFLIRPAKGDEELLAESTALGHCVYKNYKDIYRAGKTIICVIRRRNHPNTPFYTLELTTDFNKVIQCRTKGNRGTTPEIEDFKNKWFEWLHSDKKVKEKENKKKCQKTTAA